MKTKTYKIISKILICAQLCQTLQLHASHSPSGDEDFIDQLFDFDQNRGDSAGPSAQPPAQVVFPPNAQMDGPQDDDLFNDDFLNDDSFLEHIGGIFLENTMDMESEETEPCQNTDSQEEANISPAQANAVTKDRVYKSLRDVTLFDRRTINNILIYYYLSGEKVTRKTLSLLLEKEGVKFEYDETVKALFGNFKQRFLFLESYSKDVQKEIFDYLIKNPEVHRTNLKMMAKQLSGECRIYKITRYFAPQDEETINNILINHYLSDEKITGKTLSLLLEKEGIKFEKYQSFPELIRNFKKRFSFLEAYNKGVKKAVLDHFRKNPKTKNSILEKIANDLATRSLQGVSLPNSQQEEASSYIPPAQVFIPPNPQMDGPQSSGSSLNLFGHLSSLDEVLRVKPFHQRGDSLQFVDLTSPDSSITETEERAKPYQSLDSQQLYDTLPESQDLSDQDKGNNFRTIQHPEELTEEERKLINDVLIDHYEKKKEIVTSSLKSELRKKGILFKDNTIIYNLKGNFKRKLSFLEGYNKKVKKVVFDYFRNNPKANKTTLKKIAKEANISPAQVDAVTKDRVYKSFTDVTPSDRGTIYDILSGYYLSGESVGKKTLSQLLEKEGIKFENILTVRRLFGKFKEKFLFLQHYSKDVQKEVFDDLIKNPKARKPTLEKIAKDLAARSREVASSSNFQQEGASSYVPPAQTVFTFNEENYWPQNSGSSLNLFGHLSSLDEVLQVNPSDQRGDSPQLLDLTSPDSSITETEEGAKSHQSLDSQQLYGTPPERQDLFAQELHTGKKSELRSVDSIKKFTLDEWKFAFNYLTDAPERVTPNGLISEVKKIGINFKNYKNAENFIYNFKKKISFLEGYDEEVKKVVFDYFRNSPKTRKLTLENIARNSAQTPSTGKRRREEALSGSRDDTEGQPPQKRQKTT